METIPLFVRAGSILPLGAPVESTSQLQRLEKIRVYPGADADFTLYNDDGKTYAYEKGKSQITHLHWEDSARKLTHTGAAAWQGSDAEMIEVVGAK
jgi:alpha-D-xyloside xylohydrolase